jgi:phage terminase large subunit
MLSIEAELLGLLNFEDRLEGLFDHCFAQQREAIAHDSKRKVIRCSRRAGKTELAAVKLVHSSLQSPNGISLYIALTRKSAKRLLWSRLKEMCYQWRLDYEASETDLILKFENGSEIWLAGANQEDVAETLRGHAYRSVILDECASFRGHIDTLIEEILEPATLDENGDLWIMGTPSWDFSSYFYKANHNPDQWQSFYWTLFDNPNIKNSKAWVEDLKRRRGWSEDNPILLREYYGYWTKTTDELVYLFNPLRNTLHSPSSHYANKVLGIDLGFEDATALAIVAHEQDSPEAHVIHVEQHRHPLISDIAAKAKRLIDEHKIATVVIDEGGLGKAIAEEFRARYGINLKAAQKRDKRLYIELFNAELKEGRIKALEDCPVIEQWNSLNWDEGKQVEKPGQSNDCADAVLYAWRESYYYLEQVRQAKPKYGSAEYFEQQERDLIYAKEQQLMKRNNRPW